MRKFVGSLEVYGRSVLRMVLALTFSLHGYRHLFRLFPASGGRRAAVSMALDGLPHFVGVLEIAGGLLLFAGLLARPVAAILCAESLAAYLYAAAPRGLWPIRNGGNEALIYFLLFLYFAAVGPGAWSWDQLLSRVRKQAKAGALAAAVACCLLLTPSLPAQSAPDKPLMVEDIFKNVQVLKGISVNEFMETMGFFSASLGYNCTSCHTAESLGNWAKYADDIPAKRTARRMIQMVNAINKEHFGGALIVTCYTCHRGSGQPKSIPSLLEQYSAPPPEDPNETEIRGQVKGPSADQILDRYIQAAGGAERLAALKSFTAKGTYGGYDTDFLKAPYEVFAQAPDRRTTIVHTPIGDSTTAFDGRAGWVAAPDKPASLLAVPPGPDLDGLKLDADLSFPGQVKQALTQWLSGFPETAIGEKGDQEVQIIQGITAGGSRVKLFFDKNTGLLARVVRYARTVIGINPTQIDYSDYRDVAGVKMPFKWTITWTDGQSKVELTEVQPNAAIDAAKFARPAPAKMPPPTVK